MLVPLMLCVLSIVVLFLDGPFGWALFSIASLLSLFFLVETLAEHVLLTPDRLQFYRLFKTTVIPKVEITKDELTSGGGATIHTKSGRAVMVPDFGHGADVVTDAISEWLADSTTTD